MSLDALINWTRTHGPRAAVLVAAGLLVDWLCARLARLTHQRLAAAQPATPIQERWAALVSATIRIAGHLFLLGCGVVVALDFLGLGLDFSTLWKSLYTTSMQVAIVAVLALFAIRVVNLAAQYVEGTILRRRGDGDLLHRARTVGAVARNFGTALIAIVAILMILAALGLNTAPLLASAGILGIAIGFGAQTLVRDVISGLFILLEDQFAVGDTIQIGDATGDVERMTVRSTTLRGADGTLYIVPNGEIRRVANLTRDWGRAIVDVGISYEVPIDRALDVLGRTTRELACEPRMAFLLQEEPLVLGVQELGPTLVTLRTIFTTRPGEQWAVRREANRKIKEAFDREGLKIR
jgi:moderate conductance mechanosensitive channel